MAGGDVPSERARWLARLDALAAVAACVLVVALLGCVALGVVTRTLGMPFSWTDEASRFLMVWLAVFGWVLATRRGIQVRIRYFQDRLPRRSRSTIELVIQAALAALGALIAYFSVGLVVRSADLEATSLPISMAWMYVPMVLAGFVTLVQGLAEMIATLRSPRGADAATAEAMQRP